MRYVAALTGFLLIAALSPAPAQMYPGEDVTVNPAAAGTLVLRYPGDQYGRIVPPLREPGANDAPIHLRKPGRHHRAVQHNEEATAAAPEPPAQERRVVLRPPPVRREARERPAPRPVEAAPPPVLPPPAPPRTAERRAAERTPARRTAAMPAAPAPATHATDLSDLTNQDVVTPVRPAATPPEHLASIAPPPARIERAKPETAGGTPTGSILFSPNASDPTASAVDTVKALANTLNATLAGGDARVQLMAYGGPRGVKSSDTRRLSLKRAIIIRQLLIDDGVPSERIEVRAMGGADDNGPADRVDVFVRS